MSGVAGSDFSAADLLALAKLSNAAYLDDARTAVSALGMTYVTQVGDGGCSALIVLWGGYGVVAFQGTRILEVGGISWPEVWCDLNGHIVTLPDGSRAHAGFWLPLVDLWPQIEAVLPRDRPLIATGHSLGGARAHLAAKLMPGAQVVSFGAPKATDDAFWTACYGSWRAPVRVVAGRDFAPTWPPEGPWTQPAAITWLNEGTIRVVQQRPCLCDSVQDHYILSSYIARLEVLVASDVVVGRELLKSATALASS